MKQLSSFAVINIDGGDRISYTYDVIDDVTGEPVEKNAKGNFYAVNSDLKYYIDSIRDFIKNNKLSD